jgi:endonuclease YncB( thermonuclease family)
MKALISVAGLVVCLTASQSALADPCTAPLPARGTDFSGKVRYVGDGDSLCVGQSNDPHTWIEVRVADFYAPELHSPAGPQAKAALQEIAMGQMAQCTADHKSYDRIVAQCFIKGVSIGDRMRKAGIQEGGRGR